MHSLEPVMYLEWEGHSTMPPRVAYPIFMKNLQAQCMNVWWEAFCSRHINFETMLHSESEHTIFIQKVGKFSGERAQPPLQTPTPVLPAWYMRWQITLFDVMLCAHCRRRHVVGQQVVSGISTVVEVFVACVLNLIMLISYYACSLLYLERLYCFTAQT